MITNFAGAICDGLGCAPLYAIIAIPFVLAAVVIGIIGWLIFRYRAKRRNQLNNFKAKRLLVIWQLVGLGLVGLFFIGYFVIPTIIKDANWDRLQEDCARQVGYNSPADDNNPDTATAESQQAYRHCTLPDIYN